MVSELDSAPSGIRYRRLRAPAKHGESLQLPPLGDCRLNPLGAELLAGARTTEINLAETSREAREELVQLAFQYSSRYRDVSPIAANPNAIVMSGHQPALFHPGVWFKNFALDHLARRLNATPLNLVVDNDICGVTSIKAPQMNHDSARYSWIEIDSPGDNIPYEARRIRDWDVVRGFPQRVEQAMAGWVANPLARPLWKHLEPGLHADRLGHSLAAARHRLEGEAGLQSLELPISLVSQTGSFAKFAGELLFRIESFQETYHTHLANYRREHRIRSRSHPVPELNRQADWFEAPFWIWHAQQPTRRGLFVRLTPQTIELSDRRQLLVCLDRKNFVAEFLELPQQEICLRPRALITTLFSRLLASDLFLHGIGGAKYDQLTDAIALEFFGLAPPPFATLTATMKLPLAAPDVVPSDLTRLQVHKRELRYHPEVHLQAPTREADAIANEKQRWIAATPPTVTPRDRHDGIELANQNLQPWVAEQSRELEQSLAELKQKLKSSQILGSREYSFSLFPESVIEQLKMMVTGQPG